VFQIVNVEALVHGIGVPFPLDDLLVDLWTGTASLQRRRLLFLGQGAFIYFSELRFGWQTSFEGSRRVDRIIFFSRVCAGQL
jgi:hypothetical protein